MQQLEGVAKWSRPGLFESSSLVKWIQFWFNSSILQFFQQNVKSMSEYPDMLKNIITMFVIWTTKSTFEVIKFIFTF